MSLSEIRPFKESGEHSYHRRAFSHDYFAPFIYHIIIKKRVGCEAFGSVAGDARIAPGNPGCASIEESDLGRVVAKSILRLPYKFPILRLHQFCVMPDHLHLLIQVLFRSDKHLDFYIESLVSMVARRFSEMKNRTIAPEEIFEPGYCDKPLYDHRSLDALFRYIRENPHRLAMRRQFPQFFRRSRDLRIGDKEFQAYGNLFLFRNPDKLAVRLSRKFTPDEKERLREDWLAGAAEGTVLVSPFISKEEKGVRSEAEALGGKIILITHEELGERYKPAAHDFELCCAGRLLIISLGLPGGTPLSRSVCMQMNDLAAVLARS